MDVGNLVNWIQLGIWSVALVVFIGRVVRAEVPMPIKLRRLLSSNILIGVVIVLGLLGSAASLYVTYMREQYIPVSRLNQKKDLELVENRTFVNETVEIDGKSFQHCFFRNVHLVFHGKKTFALRYNNFNQTVAISSDDHRLSSFGELLTAFGMIGGADVQWGEDEQGNFQVVKQFSPPAPAPAPVPAPAPTKQP